MRPAIDRGDVGSHRRSLASKPMMDLSVVIPTYNRAAFLGEALQSVARQTVPPLEVIVIDGASTDDTEGCVRAAPSVSRVLYHRLRENAGAAVARNVGVELAKGEIIVFLDSDDLLDPTHHARVLDILGATPDVKVFSCDSRLIDTSGEWIRGGHGYVEIQCAIKGRTMTGGVRSLKDIFLLSTPFAGCAVRREVYRGVGGLRQELFPLEDYDLMLRIAAAGHTVHYEHEPLALYRMHGDNSSGRRRAVFVQRQRLRCVLDALRCSPELQRLGRRTLGRVAEVRRELALTQIKAHEPLSGTGQLLRSFAEDPTGVAELGRLLSRKLRSMIRWRHSDGSGSSMGWK